MKQLIAFLTIAGFMTFGIGNTVLAQEPDNQQAQQTEVMTPAPDSTVAATEAAAVDETVAPAEAEHRWHGGR